MRHVPQCSTFYQRTPARSPAWVIGAWSFIGLRRTPCGLSPIRLSSTLRLGLEESSSKSGSKTVEPSSRLGHWSFLLELSTIASNLRISSLPSRATPCPFTTYDHGGIPCATCASP